MFKHDIHGDRPRIPDGMPDSADPFPPEFFANLGCPLASAHVKAKAVEVYPTDATKDPGRHCKGARLTLSFILVLGFFVDFCKVRCFAPGYISSLVTLGAC